MNNFEALKKTSIENARKRATMQHKILNPGDSLSGVFRGTTHYSMRPKEKDAMVIECDGTMFTYPMNDYAKAQLEVQGAVKNRSIVTVSNNGMVKGKDNTMYPHITYDVTDPLLDAADSQFLLDATAEDDISALTEV